VEVVRVQTVLEQIGLVGLVRAEVGRAPIVREMVGLTQVGLTQTAPETIVQETTDQLVPPLPVKHDRLHRAVPLLSRADQHTRLDRARHVRATLAKINRPRRIVHLLRGLHNKVVRRINGQFNNRSRLRSRKPNRNQDSRDLQPG
jgi:hypothetical protein